jgi:ribonucleoside-diphosphate reductase alpha subunit
MEQIMRVTKRNGELEEMAFDKIQTRLKKLGNEAGLHINYQQLTIKVIDQLFDTISTTQIDELAAEQCESLSTLHPDYGILASRIIVSNHHKNTQASYYEIVKDLYLHLDPYDGTHTPIVSKELWEFVQKYKDELETMIDHNRDYLIDYFGFKTLERAYLLKMNEKVVERPQHMWLRVAIGIHGYTDAIANANAFEKVKETYQLMSQKYFTHATPTLFNAGTPQQQMSSCFLVAMEEDSIEGIFNTLKDCAHISKYSGGIGIHIHNIRSKGSRIKGTNGITDGIVPMLRVYNNMAKYVNQSARRNGSVAVYLEPWHADVFDFLEMKKNHGEEEMKGRDLFYALWIPDLFMKRVKEVNGQWSLFCPNECPGLHEVFGEEFDALYEKYEKEGKARRVVQARELWFAILDAQMETGTPYLLYKDAVNCKSNQKNVGVIKSSNLCTEIMEYSDKDETAVCNLASIALPAFVCLETRQFLYDKLHEVTQVVTENLNRVIDINFYPTEKTRRSNMRHRPIGIGVQGFADALVMMDIPYHSEDAKKINKYIFETIYHAALTKSMILAEKDGPYSTFEGSPASNGILQFDLWGVTPSNRYDWADLKSLIREKGIRNSLLVAPMPTASTSQILGYNECFEPFTSNIYSRRTIAGEFIVVNKYLVRELMSIGQWNEQMKNNIIANKGSIQHLTMLPEHIRNKYKIVWEMPMKHLIDMAADRGPFICQSQSLNLWMEDPVYNKLTSMHFYAWEKGLKTGIYYLRRKAKHQAQQFTIEPELVETEKEEICEMCSA